MLIRTPFLRVAALAFLALLPQPLFAMSPELSSFYSCLDNASKEADFSKRPNCEELLKGDNFKKFSNEPIDPLGPPTPVSEAKLTVERIPFVHNKTKTFYALRVTAIDKDSLFYPDLEPGYIIFGSSNGKVFGDVFDDGYIDSPEAFSARFAKVKQSGRNTIVSLAIFVPKNGVDATKASPNDYDLATKDKTGGLDYEIYSNVKGCIKTYVKDCH